MTEENTQNKETTTNDVLLNHFANLADEFGFEFPITLNVKGLIISGNLTGKTPFLKNLVEITRNITTPDPAIKEALNSLANKMDENIDQLVAEEKAKSENDSDKDLQFIHLRNARIINDHGVIPADRGVFWRGRIDSVDGYWFGKVGPD